MYFESRMYFLAWTPSSTRIVDFESITPHSISNCIFYSFCIQKWESFFLLLLLLFCSLKRWQPNVLQRDRKRNGQTWVQNLQNKSKSWLLNSIRDEEALLQLHNLMITYLVNFQTRPRRKFLPLSPLRSLRTARPFLLPTLTSFESLDVDLTLKFSWWNSKRPGVSMP